MKNVLIIPDGAADAPLEALGGKTAFEAARTPNLDALSALGRLGTAKTTPAGMPCGSDVCTMSLLGYDPAEKLDALLKAKLDPELLAVALESIAQLAVRKGTPFTTRYSARLVASMKPSSQAASHFSLTKVVLLTIAAAIVRQLLTVS